MALPPPEPLALLNLLAVGLSVGIEETIYAAHHHREVQAKQPDYGFLMIENAKNTFNELILTMMFYVLSLGIENPRSSLLLGVKATLEVDGLLRRIPCNRP